MIQRLNIILKGSAGPEMTGLLASPIVKLPWLLYQKDCRWLRLHFMP